MNKKGAYAYWFLVPAIALIVVFSLWPIIKLFTYTFFDFRLNDQQKSGLYVSERFNFDLFQESQMYVSLFLEEDRSHITSESDLTRVDQLITKSDKLQNQFSDRQGVQKISDDEKETLSSFYKEAALVVSEINEKYQLTNGENLQLIVEDLNSSIIPSNFIGLKGYKTVLTDGRVGTALINTLAFTIVSVALELVLGFALALVMHKVLRAQGLIRTTSLIPWAIPTAVAALMWSYLYDGSSGIVAHIFETVGIVDDSRVLLLSGTGAMISAILADVWKTTPYMALLLLAGLQTIPSSLYEASSIDGATRLQSLIRITIPLLKPSILVALLFRTLDAFRVFDLIYVLTGGGPGGATETLSVYGYKIMFAQTNFGYGSIVVMIMFVSVALIASLYVKVLGANLMEKS